QEGLNKAMMNVMALSEQYPDLKANTNFLQLQTDLTAIEEKVNLARRYYNGTVRDYNTALGIFPSNILAGMFNFGPEVFFQEEESAKAVPKVNFN
nr:LemA family protein [Bacteroidia bacterium]